MPRAWQDGGAPPEAEARSEKSEKSEKRERREKREKRERREKGDGRWIREENAERREQQ